jgi:general secretion pathway protein D
MPPPDPQSMGLVGATPASAMNQMGGGFGFGQMGGYQPYGQGMFGNGPPGQGTSSSTVPSAATALAAPMAGANTSQLIILYHPSNIDQFSKIQRIIRNVIDKPAKQVYVEGLVLEIDEGKTSELGVQWSKTSSNGRNSVSLGALGQLNTGAATDAAQFVINGVASPLNAGQFMAKLNAMINSNQAEVLSRPSVLTLDNRQAVIRIGTDIPIATSSNTPSGTGANSTAFNFNYQPTGILLNIRPRISEDSQEISMLIDATVSATVPGADLRISDSSGAMLANAPTISTRKIQTYARIANNTPLIIGGLVSKSNINTASKVPLLGDMPVVGNLFGYDNKNKTKSEVIIVLTPSILTEEFRATKMQYPKDDERFDQFDTTLFRTSYRIRAEDLIDSNYIRTNQKLLDYRTAANNLISFNPNLATHYPISVFQGTKVPGEFLFVTGMMSRMLDRLKYADKVNIDLLGYFEGADVVQAKRQTIGGILKAMGDGKNVESFFKNNPQKALALTFHQSRNSSAVRAWTAEPTPEVRLVDCSDRETWKKLLWQMNQADEHGQQNQYTILLHDMSDLDRLRVAVAVKNTILNNGNEAAIIFDNFLPGRIVHMQEVSETWSRILDANIAHYFFLGEHYYPAFSKALEKSMLDMEKELDNSAYKKQRVISSISQ